MANGSTIDKTTKVSLGLGIAACGIALAIVGGIIHGVRKLDSIETEIRLLRKDFQHHTAMPHDGALQISSFRAWIREARSKYPEMPPYVPE